MSGRPVAASPLRPAPPSDTPAVAAAGLADPESHLASLGPAMLARYPGALALARGDGSVVPLNTDGAALAHLLRGAMRAQLDALLAQASDAGVAQSEALRFGDERLGSAISILIVPLAEGAEDDTEFLVLGRDATLDRNLREALIESRRRYKDLVECSSDFVWETGPDGTFDFVTTRGALGRDPETLVGSSPRELLDRRRPVPDPFPFEAEVPLEDVEVWFLDARGDAVCMLVSCVPLYGADGAAEGARGVCKDVTHVRMRDEALARARAREALLAGIVRAIREEVEPDRLLETAARALAEALGGDACWIYRARDDGGLTFASGHGDAEIAPCAAEMLATVDGAMTAVSHDGPARVFAAPTVYRERRNGVICIARTDRRDLDEDERDVLAGVADQLAIALQQIEAQEALLALSRTDELTGLLNRRAFVAEVAERVARARRTGDTGALLYVDLDNFKAVNDERGHHEGDVALKALTVILKNNVRGLDSVGRLGGDEFALWLDAVDEPLASRKAEALAEACHALARFSEGLPRPLGVSIGVAVFDPESSEELDDLFARADAAMYRAKQSGKGRHDLAPPAGACEAFR